MLLLLSPAKNLDFSPAPATLPATKPALSKDAAEIAAVAKNLTPGDLKRLMGISDKLATLNHARFQAWKARGKPAEAKQAALAFNGEVYLGLDAKTLTEDDFAFAQDHVRILSGLYGLLRPLDVIQPYRLEMGRSLKNPRGANLYAFWGDRIAKEARKAAKAQTDPTVVNLASAEYFKAVDQDALKLPIVTPQFLDEKGGKLRSLMFFAKRARGEMARWAIQHRVETAEDLKRYDGPMGYRFRPDLSSEAKWVFARKQPALKAAAKKAA